MGDMVYGLLKKALDAASLRQKVIANNIANINTRGFKRSEVIFEEKLRNEMNKYDVDNERVQSINAEVYRDETTSIREDGNNVDIDIEMSNMAANNILYNSLISQVNTKIGIMRYIINEGRK